MAKRHKCPRCGKATFGSVSEGGCYWALCQSCLDEDLTEIRALYDNQTYYEEAEDEDEEMYILNNE